MTLALFFSILLILTTASGFFSASETALFSLSSSRLRYYCNHKEKRKQLIYTLTKKPHDLLVTLLMMNVFVNILIQNISANIYPNLSGWLFTIAIPLTLTLLFGEIIPKSLAIQNNASIAYRIAPAIHMMYKVLGPVRKCIGKTATYVSKFIFFFLEQNKKISKEELLHVLHTSEKKGILSAAESSLIEGHLDLRDILVKEIMRPKDEIIYFSLDHDLNKLEQLFIKEECSRLPVCKKDLDTLLGIISAYDYFILTANITNTATLKEHLKKPFFIPETSSARSLLQQFSNKNETFAIVVDEYGSVAGLVTQEDIMEVVVGDIDDLIDKKQLYTEAGSQVVIASGKMEMGDFEDYFNIKLPNPYRMISIGGWLISTIGLIPKSGMKYELHGFFFHVLAADKKQIRRLYIRKLVSNTQEG